MKNSGKQFGPLFWVVVLWICAEQVLPDLLQVIVFLNQATVAQGTMG